MTTGCMIVTMTKQTWNNFQFFSIDQPNGPYLLLGKRFMEEIKNEQSLTIMTPVIRGRTDKKLTSTLVTQTFLSF